MSAARVLVAAKHVALDRTSEGLCTARFLRALAAAGHEVRCITSEGGDPGWRAPGVTIVPRPPARPSPWVTVDRVTAARRDAHRPLGPLRRHLRTGLTLAVGRDPAAAAELAAWRLALEHETRTVRPDVVVARGGGLGFEIHEALAARRGGPPWVAHLHDPYPLSAYPASYAQRTPVLSARQERSTARFLRRAAAVSVPSTRLARWFGLDLDDHTVVLPHIGGPIGHASPDRALVDRLCGDRRLLLVHSGTLLRQRSPLALLSALDRLASVSAVWADEARLVMLGRVDRHHREVPDITRLIDRLEHQGCLRVHDARSDHATALALLERCTAAVVIEADDPESPFFPAKLADYLAARRPVIALTPPRSVVRDLLGTAHPLLCTPADTAGVVDALDTVAQAWRGDRLAELAPDERARAQVTPEHGATTAGECIRSALRP